MKKEAHNKIFRVAEKILTQTAKKKLGGGFGRPGKKEQGGRPGRDIQNGGGEEGGNITGENSGGNADNAGNVGVGVKGWGCCVWWKC